MKNLNFCENSKKKIRRGGGGRVAGEGGSGRGGRVGGVGGVGSGGSGWGGVRVDVNEELKFL